MTDIDENKALIAEQATWRSRVAEVTIAYATGAAIAIALILVVLVLTGHADKFAVSACLLVGGLMLSAGFVANGVRATKRGQSNAGLISFVLVLVWLGMSVVQIVRLLS
jgi:hypothetical protein